MSDGVDNSGRAAGAALGLYGPLILVVMGAGFAVSQFLRNSTGALVPYLTTEFSLKSDGFGLLAGGFYFSFALAMIPTGILLDRYGPRAVMTVFMVIVAAGCLVFGLADNEAMLVAGRVLMGLGCAALLMGPLTVIARWFAPALFSTLTALVMATGNLGGLASTAPLSFAAGQFGWRTVFTGAAVLAVAISVVYGLGVRDAPLEHEFHSRKRESFTDAVKGVGTVLRTGNLWPVFAMHLVFYAMVAALLGMWAPAYLQSVHGLDAVGIGEVLLYMVGAVIAGMLVLGPCDRVFRTRKAIVLVSSGGMGAGLLHLAALPDMPFALAVAAMVLIGFFGGASTVLLAHGRALFEGRLIGRGLTVLNTAVMAGVFMVQSGSGLLVEQMYPNAALINNLPVSALQLVFAFMAAVLAVGTLIYLKADDIAPQI